MKAKGASTPLNEKGNGWTGSRKENSSNNKEVGWCSKTISALSMAHTTTSTGLQQPPLQPMQHHIPSQMQHHELIRTPSPGPSKNQQQHKSPRKSRVNQEIE